MMSIPLGDVALGKEPRIQHDGVAQWDGRDVPQVH